MHYFEDKENGLRKEIVLENMQYDIQLKTPQYIVCKEGLAGEAKKERLELLQNTIWFNIAISSITAGESLMQQDSNGNSQGNVNYFLMQAENNYSVLLDGKPLNKVAYHFQNNHGVVAHDVMIIGYKMPNNKKGKVELTYTDKLFNKGVIKCVFEKKALDEIPQLKG